MQVLEITIFYKQCIVELGSLQWTNGLVSPWLKNMHLLVYMDTMQDALGTIGYFMTDLINLL